MRVKKEQNMQENMRKKKTADGALPESIMSLQEKETQQNDVEKSISCKQKFDGKKKDGKAYRTWRLFCLLLPVVIFALVVCSAVSLLYQILFTKNPYVSLVVLSLIHI